MAVIHYAGADWLGVSPQIHFASAQGANFWGAVVAFAADAVVTVGVSLVTPPKPAEELAGLVWGVPDPNPRDPASVPEPVWWSSPKLLGRGRPGLIVALHLIFA